MIVKQRTALSALVGDSLKFTSHSINVPDSERRMVSSVPGAVRRPVRIVTLYFLNDSFMNVWIKEDSY